MGDNHLAWMAGHIDQVSDKERREAEEKLARQQAQEKAAREEEILRAEFKVVATKANGLAARMAQDAHRLLLQASSEPDTALTVTFDWTFKIYRFHKIVVSSEKRSREVNLGRAWVIREPRTYSRGLW